jgi:hypothetical protein
VENDETDREAGAGIRNTGVEIASWNDGGGKSGTVRSNKDEHSTNYIFNSCIYPNFVGAIQVS